MEFSLGVSRNQFAKLARKVGSGILQAAHGMGEGFAQANQGEAGLRRNAAIMNGDETAKAVAAQAFKVPDVPPRQ